ncbi:Type II restriction enzyme, methylase subunit YeeA [Candidatus Burkholderia humilis]|nr:Type II restriction enzyme, methylase subunit YeeA [Candidatus Burkholderia humilis]
MRSLLDFAAKRLAIAMNAVEIEAAVSGLADQPFDAAAFAFAFLAAFGIDDATIRRLRARGSYRDVRLRNLIHIVICDAGAVRDTLASRRARSRFTVVTTDGHALAAHTSRGDKTLACAYRDLADHFGFFLPLAGIAVIEQIRDDPIDIRAAGRLNALYVELMRANPDWLMRANPDWSSAARRADMNRFLARLVLSFFAADIGITRVMEPSENVPRFSRAARAPLKRARELNWRDINPDIFGSLLQAVADENERSALGMHYTSTPNILKVLNPLFLDDLRAALQNTGRNERKLSALHERLTRIRVFDPACGSSNFLVIAYKQMREIEAEIYRRLANPRAQQNRPGKFSRHRIARISGGDCATRARHRESSVRRAARSKLRGNRHRLRQCVENRLAARVSRIER